MTRSATLLLALTTALGLPAAAAADTDDVKDLKVGVKVGQRLPHFQAQVADLTGEEAKLSPIDSHELSQPTALVFMNQGCPYCTKYSGRMKKMVDSYGKRGVDFVFVYSVRSESTDSKVKFHRSKGLVAAELLNDKDAALAKLLKVQKTPELLLVAKSGEVLFRGGLDDNPLNEKKVKKTYFTNAIDEHLAGKEVSVKTSPLYG